MVHIKLVNFKNRHDSEYEIKDGKITLIRGPSGIGKSTLFHAMEWCLYGKLTGVSSDSSPKSKTSITLTTVIKNSTITVFRQRNPGLLKLVLKSGKNTTELLDAAAQQKIYSIFGEEMIWHSSCYLSQGQRNWFFTASGKERKALLTTIAFGKVDPQEIEDVLAKLSEAHDDCRRKLDKLTAEYEINQSNYQTLIDSEDYQEMTQEEIDKLKFDLSVLKNRLPNLRKEVTNHHQKIGLKSGYEATVKQIKTELQNLSGELDPEYVEQLETERMMLNDAKRIKAERESLTTKLRQAQQEYETYIEAIDISYSDIDATLADAKYKSEYRRKSEQHAKICQAHDIDYNEQSIYDEKSNLQQKIDEQPLIVEANQWRQKQIKLEKMRANLPSPMCDDIEPENPALLRKQLEEMLKSQNVLYCPHCEEPVKYQSGKLIACKVDTPKISEKDASELRQRIDELDKLHVIWRKYQAEVAAFERLEVPDEYYLSMQPIDSYAFSKIVEKLNKIKHVEYFEPLTGPTDAELYQAVSKARAAYTISENQEKLAKLSNVEDNKERLEEINKLLNAHNTMSNKKQILSKELLRVTNLLNNIVIDDKIEQKHKDCIDAIAEYTETIRLGENNIKIVKEYEKLEKQYTQIEVLSDSLLDHSKLLAIANDLEAESLKQVADSINKCLEYVIPLIFDDQISIQVDTVKVTKDGRARPKVNLKITRNGFEVSDIKLLSGGEGDRISFALTLALNLMCDRKILLLDETFSSIGDELKESAVEVVRKLCPDTTTCVVMHDGIEGIYDDILTI